MTQYLIALDLDGTTLYDWQTLTENTISTIEKVKALGHKVIIATGRPFRSSKRFYDALNLDTPIVNYNGALVQHPFDESFPLQQQYIPLEAVTQIFNDLEPYIENAFCEHREHIYLFNHNETILPLVHPDGGVIIEGRFEDTLKQDPHGFIILAKLGQHEVIQRYIDERFNGSLKHRNWGGETNQVIEVYSPLTCKGNAIKHLADYYNIPYERTMAFGDGDNDLEMLRSVKFGVAMANAREEVLEATPYHTLSNKEDGVAHFLKEFFKLS